MRGLGIVISSALLISEMTYLRGCKQPCLICVVGSHMDFSDSPANWRWESGLVDWASREVDNPQMNFKQWGFWLGEVSLARYLNWRHIA